MSSSSIDSSTQGARSGARAVAKKRGGIPFGYVVIGIVVLGIAVLVLVTVGGGRYELGVGAVATAPEAFNDKEVRVRGQIKEGSITATTVGGKPLTSFTLVDGEGHEIDIVSRDSPPDNFEGGKSCIVEGRYSKGDGAGSQGGHIDSTRLTMKCPSKYSATDGKPAASEDLYQRYRKAPEPGDPQTGPRS